MAVSCEAEKVSSLLELIDWRGDTPRSVGWGCAANFPKFLLYLFMTKICNFPYPIYDLAKKYLLPRNIPNSRLKCYNHILFKTKMAKIDALFMTKNYG